MGHENDLREEPTDDITPNGMDTGGEMYSAYGRERDPRGTLTPGALMQTMVIPLRSRRRERALTVQKIQHAVPVFGLLPAGVQALKRGALGFDLALAVVEIATSVLLVVTIGRSLRTARAHGRPGLHHTHGVDWVDIWAAGVLFAEAAERWHLTHHIARPTILTGIITLALGLFHRPLSAAGERRRSLRVTDEGIYVGGKPFKSFTARWNEIAAVTANETFAVIRTHSGRIRRLDLSDLENAGAVRAALDEAQAHLKTHGANESPPPPR